MKNSILLKELSENSFDKIVMYDKLKAGDWGLRICSDESWWFTFTDYNNSTPSDN
jgi:hypothetical protein